MISASKAEVEAANDTTCTLGAWALDTRAERYLCESSDAAKPASLAFEDIQ